MGCGGKGSQLPPGRKEMRGTILAFANLERICGLGKLLLNNRVVDWCTALRLGNLGQGTPFLQVSDTYMGGGNLY